MVINSKRPSAGLKYTGVENICHFRQKLPFVSETVRDRLIVTTDH